MLIGGSAATPSTPRRQARQNGVVQDSQGAHRSFVSYIDKSRDYYAAQGYDRPYRWAVHEDAPFTTLTRGLNGVTVGIVTTAARTLEDQRGPFAEPTQPTPASMETSHLSWHKTATHTDDLGSFLPIEHLTALAEAGEIGALSERFYGLPTNYSHRRTVAWSERIVEWAHEDGVDLMLLVPL